MGGSKVGSGLLQIDPTHKLNFPGHLKKNLIQKSKQRHTTRKRKSQNGGCQK